jgi:dynein heavy chain
MYEETQWEALKYLIALVNYGGHVTDDWDMRLLQTYMNSYFKEESLVPFFKLSALPTYYVPKDGNLNSYREFVNMMPASDHPEAFGQHPNGDIASQIKETKLLFDTLLSLQPAVTSSANSNKKSTEEEVLELAGKILETLPAKIDYENTVSIFREDNSPLKIVLLQEIERYNILLDEIKESLISLQKGIQGLVVMSADLEEIFKCVFEARVPQSWQKMYPSMKPLAAWTRDLIQRVEQLARWSETAHAPSLFWMSGFTFPTGFLTAVLQTSARQYNVSCLVGFEMGRDFRNIFKWS